MHGKKNIKMNALHACVYIHNAVQAFAITAQRAHIITAESWQKHLQTP